MAVAGMVVVGAGECGCRAALALRNKGHAGPITLIGAEPHDPCERPPLSKDVQRRGGHKPIATASALKDAEISYRASVTAMAIDRADRSVVLSSSAKVPYDKLLIATGAAPRSLPADMSGETRTFRTFDDALGLAGAVRSPGQAVIVGAGLIGMELAALLRMHGMNVRVVERATGPLQRGVPRRLADMIAARHRREGVDFHFGADIVDVTRGAVALEDGQELRSDLTIVAIGVAPQTARAASAGLEVDDGVCVDETLRTSDPNIFAGGDCACVDHPRYRRRVRLESWRNAIDHGELAASNMLGAGAPLTSLPWFWSDQYDLCLQVAGLVDDAAPLIVRTLQDGAELQFQLSPDGQIDAVSALGPRPVIAKPFRLAEMLVERRMRIDPDHLEDPSVNLKSLLATPHPAV